MKKHTILFPLSFAAYIAFVYASPYVSARTWADAVAVISVLAFVYQITYIIFLRKKLHISFGRAFASFFLWLAVIADMLVLYTYGDAFINGYAHSFLTFTSGPYYGFEAWSKMTWTSLILIPLLAISIIYQFVYFIILHKKKQNQL